jgi:iron complex outermembrane receptor protein
MFHRSTISPLLCSVAVCGIVAASPASAQGAGAQTFAIPAQDLGSALSAFSRATGLQVAANPKTLQGRRSQAVSGRLTPAAALARLIRGSDVDAYIAGDTVVVRSAKVRPIAMRAAAPRAAAQEPVTDPAPTADTAEATGGEILVTGYRESLSRALDIKRGAVGSQDVIVAQDIAAFPDLNLAESLQRIPGIAISRDSGEGRQISLRGLGPDFTRTQLNGMEVLTNTASGFDNRGSVSRTRAFDYSIFASELFNQVTVEKSFAAEQDEGGIGGTVKLRTAKPFDYPGLKVVASAKGLVNSYTDKVTPRLVGLVSNRWGDFGALLSVAYSTADTVEYGYRNWNWSRLNFGAANIGAGVSAPDADTLLNATGDNRAFNSRAQTYATWANHRERLGVTGALQYQPSDKVDFSLDLLYGQLTNKRREYAMGAAGTNGVAANDIRGTQVLNSVVIDEHNSIVSADFSGVDMRSESKKSYDKTTFYQAVLNGDVEFSDRFKVSMLGGYSRSVFAEPEFDKVYLEAVGKDFAFDGAGRTVPLNSYGFDIADPTQWGLMRTDTREDRIVSSYVNGQLDADYAVTDNSHIKIGGAYKQFKNSGWQRSRFAVYEDLATVPNAPSYVFDEKSIAPYVVGDVDGTYLLTGENRDLTGANNTVGTDYDLRERTLSAYAQYDITAELGDIDMRANIGVRYYSTRLRSAGTAAAGTVLVPVVLTSRYDGFLPAANIAFDLSRSTVLRLSANRNVSRPALSDLRAAGTVRVASFGGGIMAGNPELAPFRADSVEGSLEYYDGRRGFAAIGLFYKKMKSFITSEVTTVPYGSTGYPLELLEPGQDGSILYTYTRPVNGEGASIKGIEVSGQRDFDFLPAPFDKLGVVGNATFAQGKSDVLYGTVPVRLALPQLSKWSYNATLYYDTPTWGVRVSSAYRSNYRIAAGGSGNIGEWMKGTNNFDASAYFNIGDKIKLIAEAINITDEPIVQYTDRDARRLMSSTKSGRTFTLGAALQF